MDDEIGYLRQVFATAPDSIMIFERDGDRFRIAASNGAGDAYVGYSVGQCVGQAVEEAFDADLAALLNAALARACATRAPERAEGRFLLTKGERQIRFLLNPMPRGDAPVTSVIVFGRDVTRMRSADLERFEHRRDFFNLVEGAPEPMARYDAALRRIYVNPSFELLRSGTAASGETSEPDADPEFLRYLRRVLDGKISAEFDLRHVIARGQRRVHAVRAFRELDPDGKPIGVMTIWRDTTAREAMAQRLKERERDFRQLVENSPDFIARFDLDGGVIYENPNFHRIAGPRDGEVCATAPADLAALNARVLSVARTGAPAEIELSHLDAAGRVWWSHTRLVPEFGPAGDIVSVLGIGRDVTETVTYRDQLKRAAFYDALTGLPNRARLVEEAGRWIAENSPFALMILDLDGFKEVNDGLGHEAGDKLLQVIARRLGICLGENGLIARLGGDEFALLMRDPAGDMAPDVAQSILASICEPTLVDGKEIFVSGSIGVSRFPVDGDEVDQLMRNADAAMYRAKAAGRNNFQIYTADMTARAVERMMLAGSLRKAEQRGELELYFQPQIDLTHGDLCGAEALLRWNHPDLGLVMPERFISIAEETGLIVDIGRWALEEACRTAARWNTGRARPFRVAVNLSPRQFMMNDMVATVLATLEQTGCDPRWIELEITESLLMGHDDLVESVSALSRHGVAIAVDDFGTGYSALGYLHRFPIHKLKIDRSFVAGIESDRKKVGIVRAIISIAAALDMRLVAEGVETAAQANILDGFGCHAAQGYHFGRPMPADQFTGSFVNGQQFDMPWDSLALV